MKKLKSITFFVLLSILISCDNPSENNYIVDATIIAIKEDTGKPLDNAIVAIHVYGGKSYTKITDSQGRAKFQSVNTGSWDVDIHILDNGNNYPDAHYDEYFENIDLPKKDAWTFRVKNLR